MDPMNQPNPQPNPQPKPRGSVLIVSPHLDDEVLGCSSFLTPEVTVLYLTEAHPMFPNGLNISESHLLEQKVGYRTIRHQQPTNHLPSVPIWDLVSILEEAVKSVRPDTVLLPFPSYNQDHQAVYSAAMIALRVHDMNHFAKQVLVYEEPDVWGTMGRVFRPAYFRKIDITEKINLWMIYRSQQRGHRTIEDIKTIAHARGMQSCQQWAEAFEVLRWTE